MPAARFPKRPKLTQTPRLDIDASLHPKIDSFLKSARQCTQQTTPLESCLQDEMRILERLYYKGVNQHRSALFWRRAKEVRRLGRRVLEARVLGLLDDLRYSFYVGEDVERNPKILKGAWSQVPGAKFLVFMYERLRDITELICTAKERLLKAHHSLSLMMQTGAFLQLVVLLTAIVARINAVMEELGTALQSFLEGFDVLLEALGQKKRKLKLTGETKTPGPARRAVTSRSMDRVDNAQLDIGESFGEDLGSTVLRKTGSPREAHIPEDIHAIESSWKQEEQILCSSHDSVSVPDNPSIIIKTDVTANDIEAAVDEKSRVGKASPKEAAKVRKKKKKRRDEIDEIFGTL